MQSLSSRIWTRVAVSISYDDNHFTTGTSIQFCMALNYLSLLDQVHSQLVRKEYDNHHLS